MITGRFVSRISPLSAPLKNTCEVDFKPDQTVFVLQQEFAVTDANSDKPVLGTGGAGPCIILAIYDQKNKIAILAHVDISCLYDIPTLFKNISIEHSVAHISGGTGCEEDSLKIIDILERHKIKIVNADIERDRYLPASLAIDARTGNIYSPVDISQLHIPLNFDIRFSKILFDVKMTPLRLCYTSKTLVKIDERKESSTASAITLGIIKPPVKSITQLKNPDYCGLKSGFFGK